jgi:type VII secretion-associated serine protease mycosin
VIRRPRRPRARLSFRRRGNVRSTVRVTAAVLASTAAAAAFTLTAAAPAQADTQRDAEWPISFLDLTQAQKISTGSGVTVGLLDTGVVQGRDDLSGQITTGPDYAGGVEQPGGPDWGEHGTCMASIIAGHGRGADDADGTLGVAPDAHILSVRVIRDDDAPDINDPLSDPNSLADGINYAVSHGVQVVSMSLGGTGGPDSDSSEVSDAIRNALAHNVVVVVAAGNDGQSGNPISYPGGERGVITVSAVDSSGDHADFSSSGWDVDVAAPGVSVPCDAADSDDEYLVGDGTSQATAYTAGLVALIRSENSTLSPAQVRDVIEQTTTDKPAGGRNDENGYGVIDPVAALHAAAGMKGADEAPAAGPGPSSGYFGYGPTEIVSEQSASLSPLMRAISGGVVLFALGLFVFVRSMRRGPVPATAAAPAAAPLFDPAGATQVTQATQPIQPTQPMPPPYGPFAQPPPMPPPPAPPQPAPPEPAAPPMPENRTPPDDFPPWDG